MAELPVILTTQELHDAEMAVIAFSRHLTDKTAKESVLLNGLEDKLRKAYVEADFIDFRTGEDYISGRKPIDIHSIVHNTACELFGYLQGFLKPGYSDEQIIDEIKRSLYEIHYFKRG